MKDNAQKALFRLWIARNAMQNKTAIERRWAANEALRDLTNAIRAWRTLGNHPTQREALNRRQRRAQREGVAIYHVAKCFGIEVFTRKWATPGPFGQ